MEGEVMVLILIPFSQEVGEGAPSPPQADRGADEGLGGGEIIS